MTLILMGIATTLVGVLPTFETAGYFAPIALVVLRLIQGLAIGGEYGGAAVYVVEHAPANRRGFFTSFIQTTATVGFFWRSSSCLRAGCRSAKYSSSSGAGEFRPAVIGFDRPVPLFAPQAERVAGV